MSYVVALKYNLMFQLRHQTKPVEAYQFAFQPTLEFDFYQPQKAQIFCVTFSKMAEVL